MSIILLYKALHVFFMVAWFAGIFYLPRLFVYHAQNSNAECDAVFKVMERRLLYFVTPFAALKLVLVLLLYGYHGWCFKLLADFKHNRNRHSARFYRIFNELPVLVLLAIILLATLKPQLY